MNKLPVILAVFLSLLSGVLYGQRGTLKGTVTDDTGVPVENMTVIAVDQNVSTFTNHYGQFTMQLPSGVNIRLLFQQFSYRDTLITIQLHSGEVRNLSVVLPAQASSRLSGAPTGLRRFLRSLFRSMPWRGHLTHIRSSTGRAPRPSA